MIIRGYGQLPPTYAPDIGEVVLARRSNSARWLRAVVLGVKRRKTGGLWMKVHWLEDDPDPGTSNPRYASPITAGGTGFIVHRPPQAFLVKQLPKDSAGPAAAPVADSAGDDAVDGDG